MNFGNRGVSLSAVDQYKLQLLEQRFSVSGNVRHRLRFNDGKRQVLSRIGADVSPLLEILRGL